MIGSLARMETETTSKGLSRRSPHSRTNRVLRIVWHVVYLLLFRLSPRVCHGWRRFLLRSFGAKVGKRVRTFPNIKVWAPWNLVLHDHCALGSGVDCYSVGKIVIGRNATISQDTVLCTASHDFSDLELPLTIGDIYIGDYAWVTARVFVMPHVQIGEGTVVGVRSTVLSNLPAWSVAAGTPCKIIGPRRLRDRTGESPTIEE